MKPYQKLLRSPIEDQDADKFAAAVSFEDSVLVSENGGFQWSTFHCKISGLSAQFSKSDKSQVHAKEITYSFLRSTVCLERTELPPFHSFNVLRIIFASGYAVDMRLPDETGGKNSRIESLSKKLTFLWKKNFSKEEYRERRASAHVIPSSYLPSPIPITENSESSFLLGRRTSVGHQSLLNLLSQLVEKD